MRILTTLALLLAATGMHAAQMTDKQSVNMGAEAPPYTYADLADLALAAPVVLSGTVAKTVRLKGEQAAGVPPGKVRLYVTVTVATLIRGANGIPSTVNYLVDLPLDSRGRPPKLKKAQVILLAAAAQGGDLRLVAPDAQLPWAAEAEATLRAILKEATAADAPPPITGVGSAFHVPGNLPGESETQIFLRTADRRPVSLSVLRRPGAAPGWSVALSEIVDEAAAPPPPASLLWYRLACGLPRTLPYEALAGADPAQAEMIRADYQVVIRQLGPCERSRQRD